MDITVEDIKNARESLKNIAYKTSLVHNTTFSELSGNNVFLKMENLQKTGSFKIRGAFNKIVHLPKENQKNGVIAASAGNHAQGVALAATSYGIKSTIVMPKHAPLSKIAATKNYGADVILWGEMYDEAYTRAKEIQEETGATFVHPFDDPYVIAGQGTIGLEIIEDLPDTDIIVAPIGGGGLISGVAIAAKSLKPDIKIIGVQTENVPSMINSVKKDAVDTVSAVPTIADGIAVKTPGDITFDIVKKYIDDILIVSEEDIASAILFLMERAKVVSEGAGAVSIAAILNKMDNIKNKKIVALISGGNIDVNMLSRIMDKGLIRSGRKVVIDTLVKDRPGVLSKLLKLIAETGANVLSVYHYRTTMDVPIGYTRVELELETANKEHIEEIKKLLALQNYNFNIL